MSYRATNRWVNAMRRPETSDLPCDPIPAPEMIHETREPGAVKRSNARRPGGGASGDGFFLLNEPRSPTQAALFFMI
jgi:hypothetical protein